MKITKNTKKFKSGVYAKIASDKVIADFKSQTGIDMGGIIADLLILDINESVFSIECASNTVQSVR